LALKDLIYLIPIIFITRNFLSRDFYVTVFHSLFAACLIYILFYFGIRETPPGLVGFIILTYKTLALYFGLSVVNLVNIIYWICFKRTTNGFTRFDKVYEIHVYKTKSDHQFAARVTKALRKAREKGYLVEFTTDHYTQGQITSRYGDSVVSIRPAHPLTSMGTEFYKLLFRVKRNKRRRYLTTVVDPSLITSKTKKQDLSTK
jgi:hypothetical protein